MRSLSVLGIVFALAGCASPAPTAAEPTVNVPELVGERWQECFDLLGTPDAVVKFTQGGANAAEGTATVATAMGVLTFDVGVTDAGEVLTVPTGTSVEVLAKVGC